MVNWKNGLTGNPDDVQSIDAWLPVGTVKRRYATPPAFTRRLAGVASDSGTTASGYLPSAPPLPFASPGKMLRMFQLGARNRASVTPGTSSLNTAVAQSRICVR